MGRGRCMFNNADTRASRSMPSEAKACSKISTLVGIFFSERETSRALASWLSAANANFFGQAAQKCYAFLARQKPRFLSVLCTAQKVAADGVRIIFTHRDVHHLTRCKKCLILYENVAVLEKTTIRTYSASHTGIPCRVSHAS